MSRLAEALRRAAAHERRPEVVRTLREAEVADTPFAPAWDFALAEPRATSAASPELAPFSGGPVTAESSTSQVSAGTSDPPSVLLDTQLAMNWPQPVAPDFSGKLVVMPQIEPVALEEYRALATALEREQHQRGVRVVAVLSAVAAEGRTLTAVNIALTLSASRDRTVLLVDAHPHAPRLHHVFQVSAGTGLRGCQQAASIRDLPIVRLSKFLSLLPGGRSSGTPAAADSTSHTVAALRQALSAYDWVIVDTPPIIGQPEGPALAELSDAAVLVIDTRTPRADVQQAVETIGRRRILGVVLNRADDGVVRRRRSNPTVGPTESLLLR